MTSLNASLTLLGPEIFIALAAMVFLVFGAFKGNKATALLSRLSIVVYFLAGFLVLGMDWTSTKVINGFFVIDQFGSVFKLTILAAAAGVTAISTRYLHQEQIARFEYPVLMMLAVLGMLLMVSAQNFLSLYMALELQSLSLYVLAAIRRNHVKSSEAGIKYFVLGALSSGMLLFGISLIYGFSATIDFTAISTFLGTDGVDQTGIIIGMVFVLVGIAFKLSAFPFHMWTPDVYEGAPTSVTAFFAAVPKVAALGLLARVLFEAFGNIQDQWQQIIWALAFGSMVFSAFAAIAQTNIKRLMAYSSIGNIGYALMGLVAGTAAGLGSVITYIVIYVVMTVGVFGVILCMRRDDAAVEDIDDLKGYSQTSPVYAYALAVLMFSLSGIPPLAGFFGKLVVFQAVIASGFYVLAVAGVLASVVAAYYYLRVIKVMFFDKPTDGFDEQDNVAIRVVLVLSILFVVGFILFPEALVNIGNSAASSLIAIK